MGADQSLQCLDIPLPPQDPPMLSIEQGVLAQARTQFKVTFKSVGSSFLVIDTTSNAVVYEFKRPALSSQRILQTASGLPLMTIRGTNSTTDFNVFEGADMATAIFGITLSVCRERILFADFTDRVTEQPCRLAITGAPYTRVGMVYMERGELTSIRDKTNIKNGRYVPVARFHRKHNGAFRAISRLVEIAEGVDVSLVLMLWLIREERFLRNQH